MTNSELVSNCCGAGDIYDGKSTINLKSYIMGARYEKEDNNAI